MGILEMLEQVWPLHEGEIVVMVYEDRTDVHVHGKSSHNDEIARIFEECCKTLPEEFKVDMWEERGYMLWITDDNYVVLARGEGCYIYDGKCCTRSDRQR